MGICEVSGLGVMPLQGFLHEDEIGVRVDVAENQEGAGGAYIRCWEEWLGLRHLLEE